MGVCLGKQAWAWALTPGFGVKNADNENTGLERMTQNILDVVVGRVPALASQTPLGFWGR